MTIDELLAAGLLVGSGVPGVYARSAGFEQVRLGVDRLITETAADQAPERLIFPPLLPREQLESSGYLESFPHLAGTIFSFDGDERAAAEQHELASRHEDWSRFQAMSDVTLTPAACYPVYPAIAARGPLPDGGVMIDAGDAYVFRHEPSEDPARMQIFHQRELVRLGESDPVERWRDTWRTRGLELLRSIGLKAEAAVATDRFFGRRGRMLAASQREQELKWELVAETAPDAVTAIASINLHQDHFARKHDLRTAAGELAHTACVGFGEERVVLALLQAHGLAVEQWPDEVRRRLSL